VNLPYTNVEEAQRWGEWFGQALRDVLDALAEHPDAMAIEVAAATGYQPHEAEALLYAIERAGKATSTGTPTRWRLAAS
jgi:DNA-binding IclR family transcriptional regulator